MLMGVALRLSWGPYGRLEGPVSGGRPGPAGTAARVYAPRREPCPVRDYSSSVEVWTLWDPARGPLVSPPAKRPAVGRCGPAGRWGAPARELTRRRGSRAGGPSPVVGSGGGPPRDVRPGRR